MIYRSLTEKAVDRKSLVAEYKKAKVIGVVRLGCNYFFFRRWFKIYYVSYEEIKKCFRRVLLIPVGNGKKNMRLETLVITDSVRDLAQIQIPGTEAARKLLEEMKVKVPHADFSGPDKKKEEETN